MEPVCLLFLRAPNQRIVPNEEKMTLSQLLFIVLIIQVPFLFLIAGTPQTRVTLLGNLYPSVQSHSNSPQLAWPSSWAPRPSRASAPQHALLPAPALAALPDAAARRVVPGMPPCSETAWCAMSVPRVDREEREKMAEGIQLWQYTSEHV